MLLHISMFSLHQSSLLPYLIYFNCYSNYVFIITMQISNFILNKTNFDRKIFKLFFDTILLYSMYNLKTIPIFASNYNLNIMLRVQEICKSQGITMQDLAKRMGVTYQALYAAVSGNPTIGKLGEIAKALDVGIIDLLNEDKEENAIICPHCGKKIKIEKGE